MQFRLPQLLRKYWHLLTQPHSAVHGEDELAVARLISGLSLVLFLSGTIVCFLWQIAAIEFEPGPYISIFIIGCLLAIYLVSRTSRYKLAPYLLIIFIVAIVIVILLTAPGPMPERLVALSFLNFAILVASLLLSVRSTLIISIISMVLAVLYALIVDLSVPSIFTYLVFMSIMASLLILSSLMRNRYIQRLHESQHRYRALFNQSNDAVFIIGLDGRHIEVNQNAAEMLGYSLEEAAQLSVRDVVAPAEIELGQTVLHKLLANERLPIYERTFRRKDGTEFPVEINVELVVDEHGQPLHIQSLARDITERKEAEKALLTIISQAKQVEDKLRKQEEYLRILIEQTPIGIVTVDMDGRLIEANPRSMEILGASNSTLSVQAELLKVAHLVDLGIAQMLKEAIETGNRTELETWYTSAWDKTVYLLLRAVPHFDGLGNQIGLIVLVEDLTERIQAEAGMREMQKLDSLSILAGGIAHDFNNLLVAMLGQTSLAQAKLRPDSPVRPHIDKAVSAAKQAARLTQQLLGYSGRGQFQVAHLNLNRIIEENLHLFAVTIPKHIHLRTDFAENLPLVEVDLVQMQQVVMNLIINAAEALGQNRGTISIVTDSQFVHADENKYWQHTMKPLAAGRYVTLEVHDDGEGMPQETLKKIFEPFFTTKEKGHGLGLAAVLGIIKGHNGGLTVSSEMDQGTTFKIFLPVSTGEELIEEETPEGEFENTKGMVLIIDDEQYVRMAVADILSLDAIEVISAADGREGLAVFQERQSEIALVLLDLSMPGWSGEETMRELRKVDPNLPIILSSGYNEAEATRLFVGKGSVCFLQKPYTTQKLLETVRQFLWK